jgi:hypothetical protein
MRGVPVLLSVVLAGAALADPAPPAPQRPTWADWVGDWDGKLKWQSCSADGEEKPTLSVDATDGVLSLDLRNAGSALPALTLLEDTTGWSGQQGDVTAHVKRPKANTLELTVDLESGCQITGTLARPSIGIASCDRLSAWARIESQCTKLTKPPLENPTRLARQREQWAKAKGEARTKLSAQCTARGAKVEAALVDAGCAPHADPAIGLRGAECQALRSTSARIVRCGNVPFDLREAFEREVVVLVAASQGADKAALPVVETECRQARDRMVTIAKQAGCPL